MTPELLVARYGLAALFAGAALEGEAAVIAGGLLAHQGLLSLPAAMATAAAGSFAADQAWFALGRRYRDHRWVRRAQATAAFGKAVRALERRPRRFIFAFRFVYGVRTVSPIAIGTTQVPRRLFTTLNAAAAIIWAILFSTIGYLFGNVFEQVAGRLRHDARLWWIIGALLVLGIVVGAIGWYRRRHR